ncbi:Ribonuclease D [hydrothermal vent metagenome]|uniref:Ribonuclease D n=1 Tax=hydrothermal vent metagenome TaxID=652676 RepID=A0A3B0Z180_9ZZZZ
MEFIDTAEALTTFCDAIKESDWIALDTEFIREKTYYPRLCLIQIGVPDRAACIDPLALQSLDPVYELLMNPAITKVLHACSQDLEIFVHQKGEVPGPIFDTQLAAPLLGLAEQIGYGNAVRELLGVQLDKAQSRTDWSKRPLSSAQLEYAADDVIYLAKMYPLMCKRLDKLGRLDWLDAEFEPYGKLERYQPHPENAWRRIRGLEKLKPKALSVVQKLAAWREVRARDRDLPRNWIIKDEVIFDIARLAPGKTADLDTIRGLQPKTIERYGQLLIDMAQQARTEDPLPLPKRSRGVKASVQEDALTDILSAQLRLLSDAQGINSATVASRKDLLALVRGEESVLMKGWRKKLAGEELVALRDGRRSVSVEDSQVKIRV